MSSAQQVLPPNEYRGDHLIATAIAFMVIEIIAVGLRIWSRQIQRAKFRNDDFFVLAGLIVCIGTCITCICAVKLGGVGYHIQYVPKHQKIQWIKTSYLTAPSLYSTSASLPKMAIICIYLKIFTERPARWCCYTVAFILAMMPPISTLFFVLQCTPTAFLWNKSIPNGHCINQAYMFRYGSIPHIVTDVVMLLLPMPVVWQLHASVKVKIGLFVTFLLGSIGLVTSILRFIAFFTPIADGTWAAVPLLQWVIIEPGIYLMASCLLSYKLLLKHLAKESSLSRLFTRPWASRKSSQLPEGSSRERNPQRNATRIPSEDEGPDRKILCAQDITVESSYEEFALSELPKNTVWLKRNQGS